MPTVSFTRNLQRHLPAPTTAATGTTVAEVLAAVFAEHDQLGSYILDEHGAVRPHVVIFINGRAIRDRTRLSDAVAPDDDVYVMQALSGG